MRSGSQAVRLFDIKIRKISYVDKITFKKMAEQRSQTIENLIVTFSSLTPVPALGQAKYQAGGGGLI